MNSAIWLLAFAIVVFAASLINLVFMLWLRGWLLRQYADEVARLKGRP